MSARSLSAVCTLMFISLLASCGPVGDLFAPQPTPTPTRTRRPTATNTPLATDTPTVTATPVNTATFTPQPPTATFTQPPPTDTFTPAPPTATFTRRPPTATFTRVPPTNTPTPAFAIRVEWVNRGFPDRQLCENPVIGTHVTGLVKKANGEPLRNARRTGTIHGYLDGYGGTWGCCDGKSVPFPQNDDGTWNFDFPPVPPQGYTWHLFVSEEASEQPISEMATGVSTGECSATTGARQFQFNWVQTR